MRIPVGKTAYIPFTTLDDTGALKAPASSAGKLVKDTIVLGDTVGIGSWGTGLNYATVSISSASIGDSVYTLLVTTNIVNSLGVTITSGKQVDLLLDTDTAISRINALPTATAGATNGLALVGSKMDLNDDLKNKSGASGYDRLTDSFEALGEKSSGLTAQEVRDAMKLAPTAGTSAADSVDNKLDLTAKDATVSKPGTAQTITPPADMALNSTVAKENTLSSVALQVQALQTIDTLSYQTAMTEILAHATGNMTDASGTVTVKKRNGTDTAYTVTVDNTTRTRS
jgi:hypothetical protein